MLLVLVTARWAHLVLHVHAHSDIARTAFARRLVEAGLTIATAMPPPIYRVHHVDTHHQFNNSPEDWTGPFAFPGARFPDRPVAMWRYVVTFAPRAWIRATPIALRRNDQTCRETLALLAILVVVILAAAINDPTAATLVLLVPWVTLFIGAAVANWRHHDSCTYDDACSSANSSHRMWSGSVAFNIGYHAAHHRFPAAHWSELPRLAARDD